MISAMPSRHSSVRRLLAGTVAIVTLVAGCSGSAAGVSPAAPPPAASPATSPASTPAPAGTTPATPTPPSTAAATALPTGAVGAADPCAVVTAGEASQLVGATVAAGQEETTEGGGRLCAYRAGATAVVTVLTATAPDGASAKAWEAQFVADLSKGAPAAVHPTISEMPGWQPGVDAAFLSGHTTIQGVTISGTGMYLLKGIAFASFSVLTTGTPPTDAAVRAEAMTVVGRI